MSGNRINKMSTLGTFLSLSFGTETQHSFFQVTLREDLHGTIYVACDKRTT